MAGSRRGSRWLGVQACVLAAAVAAAAPAGERPPQVRMRIEGSGARTVIFESGLGDTLDVWRKVQPRVAAGCARTVSYDRAGYGGSDPAESARDAVNVVAELRAALARAWTLCVRTPAVAEAVLVQVHGAPVRVPLADISHLTADTKYVTVHYANGEALSDASLRAIDEAFPGRFVRIHRACLVPAERLLGLVRAADGSLRALIAGTTATPEVSRRHLPAVRKLLRG